jgi:hypothetical protein
MKKRFLLIASLLALSNEALIAQQNPTPYATPLASTPAQAVTTANAAWYRGGNNNTGPAGNANIFGTLWNSPIYTQTAGVNDLNPYAVFRCLCSPPKHSTLAHKKSLPNRSDRLFCFSWFYSSNFNRSSG